MSIELKELVNSELQPIQIQVIENLPQVPPQLLARFAQEVGQIVQRATKSLHARAANESIESTRQNLATLEETSQLVARVAQVLQGDFVPRRQFVALDATLLQTIEVVRAGHTLDRCVVRTDLSSANVWTDLQVLNVVLEVALTWAAGIGQRINLRVANSNISKHPYLVCTVRDPHDGQWRENLKSDTGFENLRWMLIRMIAQSQLLDPQRVVVDNCAILVLRFPEPNLTISQDGVSATEIPNLHIKPDAIAGGCGVMVVEPNYNWRVLIRQVLHDAGMRVNDYPSSSEAIDSIGDFIPEIVISGDTPENEKMANLLSELRRKNPFIKSIQLTEEDRLYIGEDESTEAARVGYASIREALVTAVHLAVGLFAPPSLS